MSAMSEESVDLKYYIKFLEGQLAQCYKLTGADPDGNEDWRLAPHAVEEVRRLRNEYDILTGSSNPPSYKAKTPTTQTTHPPHSSETAK